MCRFHNTRKEESVLQQCDRCVDEHQPGICCTQFSVSHTNGWSVSELWQCQHQTLSATVCSHGLLALIDLHRKHDVDGGISNRLHFTAHTFRLPLYFDDHGHSANVLSSYPGSLVSSFPCQFVFLQSSLRYRGYTFRISKPKIAFDSIASFRPTLPKA